MNREIKFRVWAKVGKFWLKPDMFAVTEKENIIYPFGISRETVEIQQFTGLQDKNGKEIYEGDIIKYSGIGVCIGEIKNPTFKTTENCYWSMNEEVKWLPIGAWSIAKIEGGEVIGNIFENPELLKS